MPCCPTCGQQLPDEESALIAERQLTGICATIFKRVRKAGAEGIRTDMLFDAIYNGNSRGGPEGGYKIISVHVHYLNRKIKRFGLRVRGGQTGHGVLTHYKLLPL